MPDSVRTSRSTLLVPLLMLAALVRPGAAQPADDGLRIYISSDMEGVVGAVTGAQLGPGGFEYARFREFMTAELNAIIEGALEAGATEIVVGDSHGNGQNLLIDRLPEDVLVVRSWPRPLMMMHGIDESFDGAILHGYHAGTNNPEGVRAHTMSSANLTAIRLNGTAMTEGSISAAIAGHFGVPVILVTGDDAAVEEVRGVVANGMVGAVVKWSHSFHSATTMTPDAAYELLRERTVEAVERIDDFEPYRVEAPIRLEVSFKNYRPSQVASYLPVVDRVDAHTVGFSGSDMVEVSKMIEFLLTYRADLSP